MTNDILRTDIELATRLLEEKRPDDQIITALTFRGIDPARAAQVVDDLRNGREVKTQTVLSTGSGLRRRSRTSDASREASQAQSSRSSKAESPPKTPRHGAAHHHKKPGISWVVPALVVVLVAVVAGMVMVQRHRAAANSASLVLELQPDGLRIGGHHVTPANVLTAVANVLGAATRTNRIGQTDTMVYAYDSQGLMIYAQKAGGTNSIILDCEASGGANGTLSAFTGSITVDGQVIRPDIDPQTLTAIKQLELSHPGSDNNVWRGRYHDLQLVFSYLKSPRRPSFIEIDLK
jgi:hypothetical protein